MHVRVEMSDAMKLLIILLLLPIGASASVVTCTGQADGRTQSISIKIGSDGHLANWNESKIAQTPARGAFGLLAENPEDGEGPFEYYHSDVTSYGMKVITAGTTADEAKIAISKDLKRGYFAYRDLGSGNGNHYIPLTCSVANITK
jgi:hypothetical protein